MTSRLLENADTVGVGSPQPAQGPVAHFQQPVWRRRVTVLALAWLAAAAITSAPELAAQDVERGKELYDRWCAECHGVDGDGLGSAAAYMLPRPRDFTLGLYQIRTTASGELPTDRDIIRVIEDGMPGTAMPGWKNKFSRSEIRDLVAYLKSFSRFFESFGPPEPLEFGSPPNMDEEALAEGRRLYEEIECFKCHGQAGRGDGSSAPTLQDDLDFPVRAADLTENWLFNGGGTAEDIYRRLRTGLDGTPMPSFSDLIDAEIYTAEQLWHLAGYVRSLAPERRPVVREVIAAERAEELPSSPGDTIWNGVERFYIPLVGQIIEQERWFAPTVDGVWVQAVHNGERLSLRLVWHDPSRSPDPAWLEWQQRVALSMFPLQDSTLAAPRPDRFAVQFPMQAPSGRERPYFLFGDRRRPAYLWNWTSERGDAMEMRATGLGTEAPISAESGDFAWASEWEAGEWRLVFSRGLSTSDSTRALQFPVGQAVPIAFFAWDGSNAEVGSRMAISSWYSIYLKEPTPKTVYYSPLLAALLTAALGVMVVWRAQRREGATDAPEST